MYARSGHPRTSSQLTMDEARSVIVGSGQSDDTQPTISITGTPSFRANLISRSGQTNRSGSSELVAPTNEYPLRLISSAEGLTGERELNNDNNNFITNESHRLASKSAFGVDNYNSSDHHHHQLEQQTSSWLPILFLSPTIIVLLVWLLSLLRRRRLHNGELIRKRHQAGIDHLIGDHHHHHYSKAASILHQNLVKTTTTSTTPVSNPRSQNVNPRYSLKDSRARLHRNHQHYGQHNNHRVSSSKLLSPQQNHELKRGGLTSKQQHDEHANNNNFTLSSASTSSTSSSSSSGASSGASTRSTVKMVVGCCDMNLHDVQQHRLCNVANGDDTQVPTTSHCITHDRPQKHHHEEQQQQQQQIPNPKAVRSADQLDINIISSSSKSSSSSSTSSCRCFMNHDETNYRNPTDDIYYGLASRLADLITHTDQYLVLLTYQEILTCLVAFLIAILNVVRMRNLFSCNLVMFALTSLKILTLLTLTSFGLTKLSNLIAFGRSSHESFSVKKQQQTKADSQRRRGAKKNNNKVSSLLDSTSSSACSMGSHGNNNNKANHNMTVNNHDSTTICRLIEKRKGTANEQHHRPDCYIHQMDAESNGLSPPPFTSPPTRREKFQKNSDRRRRGDMRLASDVRPTSGSSRTGPVTSSLDGSPPAKSSGAYELNSELGLMTRQSELGANFDGNCCLVEGSCHCFPKRQRTANRKSRSSYCLAFICILSLLIGLISLYLRLMYLASPAGIAFDALGTSNRTTTTTSINQASDNLDWSISSVYSSSKSAISSATTPAVGGAPSPTSGVGPGVKYTSDNNGSIRLQSTTTPPSTITTTTASSESQAISWSNSLGQFQQHPVTVRITQLIDYYEIQTFFSIILDTHLQTSRFQCTIGLSHTSSLSRSFNVILYGSFTLIMFVTLIMIRRLGRRILAMIDKRITNLMTKNWPNMMSLDNTHHHSKYHESTLTSTASNNTATPMIKTKNPYHHAFMRPDSAHINNNDHALINKLPKEEENSGRDRTGSRTCVGSAAYHEQQPRTTGDLLIDDETHHHEGPSLGSKGVRYAELLRRHQSSLEMHLSGRHSAKSAAVARLESMARSPSHNRKLKASTSMCSLSQQQNNHLLANRQQQSLCNSHLQYHRGSNQSAGANKRRYSINNNSNSLHNNNNNNNGTSSQPLLLNLAPGANHNNEVNHANQLHLVHGHHHNQPAWLPFGSAATVASLSNIRIQIESGGRDSATRAPNTNSTRRFDEDDVDDDDEEEEHDYEGELGLDINSPKNNNNNNNTNQQARRHLLCPIGESLHQAPSPARSLLHNNQRQVRDDDGSFVGFDGLQHATGIDDNDDGSNNDDNNHDNEARLHNNQQLPPRKQLETLTTTDTITTPTSGSSSRSSSTNGSSCMLNVTDSTGQSPKCKNKKQKKENFRKAQRQARDAKTTNIDRKAGSGHINNRTKSTTTRAMNLSHMLVIGEEGTQSSIFEATTPNQANQKTNKHSRNGLLLAQQQESEFSQPANIAKNGSGIAYNNNNNNSSYSRHESNELFLMNEQKFQYLQLSRDIRLSGWLIMFAQLLNHAPTLVSNNIHSLIPCLTPRIRVT